jgi:hypothetical protein
MTHKVVCNSDVGQLWVANRIASGWGVFYELLLTMRGRVILQGATDRQRDSIYLRCFTQSTVRYVQLYVV